MSALESGPLDTDTRTTRRKSPQPTGRSRLSVVATPNQPLRRTPFLLVLALVLGVGMVGLLVLNTTLQNQAFAARTLNREASLLANQQAQLQARVDVLRTPQTLAEKAATLGMRPNQNPAFVKLPEGRIVGNPKEVAAGPLPPWLRSTPEEVAREKSARADRTADERAAERKAAEERAAAERAAAAKKAAEKKAADKKAADQKAADQKAAAEKTKTEENQKPDTAGNR